jgi:proteasome lid subunit RPN8/RPN11
MTKVLTKPVVRFTQKAYQQMFALTDACPIEISAMGVLATKQELKEWGIDEEFYVLDFHVPDQECTGGSTIMETDSLSEISLDLRDKGIASEQVCVWWHSHVNMGTGHSGTDEAQIEDFHFDEVCVSIISNKKKELNVRVDVFSPVRYSFEQCTYCVDSISILEDGWAEKMVKDHVTQPAPTYMNITKTANIGFKQNYLRGHQRNWNNNWNNGNDWAGGSWENHTAIKVEETEDAEEVIDLSDPDVPDSPLIDLVFPDELTLLGELYEENILDATEAMEYYSKWYAKELSVDELEDQLKQLYCEVGEDQKDDRADQEYKSFLEESGMTEDSEGYLIKKVS